MNRPIRSRRTFSVAVCDTVVFSFALWTIVAHATVFAGGNLHQLIAAAMAIFGAAGLTLWRARLDIWPAKLEPTDRHEDGIASAEHARTIASSPESDLPYRTRIALAAAAILITAFYAATEDTRIMWIGLGSMAVAGLVIDTRRSSTSSQSAADPPDHERLLLGLGGLCALLSLIVQRADVDDAFYLNLAVSAVDHPTRALLAFDTLHGIAEIPLPLPTYRVHTIELLEATVAYLTNLRAADVAHYLAPVSVAFLIPMALARLFRLLTPQRWVAASLMTLAFLLASGESAYSYGMLAFPRLHQGKVALLTLALPLLIAYAIEFSRTPSMRRWLLLMAAQVGAVGLSATALWLAPVVAGVALAAAFPRLNSRADGLRGLRRFALGLAASAYPLVLALWLRGETQDIFRSAPVALSSTRQAGPSLVREAARYVLWISPFAYATLLGVLLTWSTATTPLLRRLASFSLLTFTVFLWNPYFAEAIAAHITGAPTYWRVFWAIPIPIMLGALLSSPLEFAGRERRSLGLALCALIVALLLWLPQKTALSPENGVRIAAPAWKVPPERLAEARAIAGWAPAGSWVLAPLDVSVWLPILHQHPHPLVVRHAYLPLLKERLGDEELARRVALSQLATGIKIPPHADRLLTEAIDSYPLDAVSVSNDVMENPAIRAALENSPLTRVQRGERYELWARQGTVGPQ